MNVSTLISEITPLYNTYKKSADSMHPCDSIKLMWDIGEHIKSYIAKNNIAPHALYRQVYGLSESSKDIVKKSWITREFQGRCFRIRNMFENKDTVDNLLPNLKSFTLFREAMPFFDNKKYMLKGDEKDQLLLLLNSKQPIKTILNKIRILQKDKIGIKNPRNQKLIELENEKNTFIEFYNYIYRLLKESDQTIKQALVINEIDKTYLNSLINNTSALTQDGLVFSNSSTPTNAKDIIWINYSNLIDLFLKQNDPKLVRRFRRLILPERMVKLSDMLFTLMSTKFNRPD